MNKCIKKSEGVKLSINVVVVDDDSLVAMSLKTILEVDEGIKVQAVGSDGAEALGLYERYKPDVMLMDIRMKEMNGLEAARQVLTRFPDARILFLTTFSDDEYIIEALALGVKGYILKQDFEAIIPAVSAVMKGQNVFGGQIVDKLPNLMKESGQFDYESKGISQKEYDIIQLVAQGLSNKEISEKAFLSEGTVRNYLSVILEKLELRDRTQLAVFYYQNGGK